jgi:predicted transcriptional regulator
MKLCPHCKKAILTTREKAYVVLFEKYEALTSGEVAQKIGVSLACASMGLKKLFDAGLLDREEKPEETGGIYHLYFRRNHAS